MSFKKSLLIIAFLILAIIILSSLLASVSPSTNNAYLQAYTAQISPQVSGRVVSIYVKNDEYVHKNQPLFKIDDRIYKEAVEEAKANLDTAYNQVKTLKQAILVAQQSIIENESNLAYATQRWEAMKTLIGLAVSRLDANKALTNMNNLKVSLAQAKINYNKTKDELGQDENGEYAIIKNANSALAAAEINLKETTVVSPGEGYITNNSLNSGSYASAGTAILTFISNSQWWVVANVREDNLSRIKPGQWAEITIADHPWKVFSGRVESIGHGVNLTSTGSSVDLPYIEKSNTWLQLSQRFPVNIKLLNIQHQQNSFRIGASCFVTIHTQPYGFLNLLGTFMHKIVTIWEGLF